MIKRRGIIVQFTLPWVHQWSAHNGILVNPHRHLMHVKCDVSVRHSDRDLEFIEVGERLREWLDGYRIQNPHWAKEASCEMIAEALVQYIPTAFDVEGLVKVTVMEDGENGGYVIA